MSETDPTSDVAALTVQLLSAYLSNNTVASDDLADLIRSTRAALTEDAAATATQPEPETFTPAVSVRKSLASSGHIISLIDGKPYKTLKRHLASHGLTPDTYRSRYGLPASYPMVAPDYAAHRRAVAQKIGLGSRKPSGETQDQPDLGPDVRDAAGVDTPELEQSETAAKSASSGKTSGSKTGRRKTGGKPASRAKSTGTRASATTSETVPEAPTETASPRNAKPRASKAAKPANASEASGADAANPAPSAGPDTPGENAQPAADASAPKRRGRKAASDPASTKAPASTDDAAEAESEAKPTGTSAARKSSAKPKKPQRMARASKPNTDAGDNASD